MAFEADEEILQDFLVEAGEILEQLNEQLVELEHRPNDKDLLNTVFRGFHTIKGGGSFLNLTAIVAICHRSEDVFNTLRNGQRRVDAALMDAILPVLDILNGQFVQLRAREEPAAAPLSMLEKLETFAMPESTPQAAAAVSADDDITDAEFDQLLDSAQSGKPAAAAPASSDEISEAEFDSLLDKLHTTPVAPPASAKPATPAQPAASKPAAPVTGAAKSADEITDDEFENLLDQLHSKTVSPTAPAFAAPKAPPAPKPVEPPKDTRLKLVEPKPAAPVVAHAEPHEDKSEAAHGDDKSAKAKEAAAADTTVRVDTKRLDQIMNLVGELVLVRNRLSTLEASRRDEEMAKVISNLDVVTADLQAAVMKTRMQPIKKVFGRFPRVVRDLARSLNKDVNLELHGEETDLDKNLVEALADPLVHLVRNAVDHGIEMPEVRERNGKPRAGTITLAARQEGDHILLTIEDDGGGMDPEILRRKAVEKGVLVESIAERLTDNECFNLIFLPGFSTKDQISDISGRGVGMDVVKTRIAQLNGVVEIFSQRGKGTTLSIKVPLTLAIMPTLMVKLKEQTFALPLVNVSEILHLDLRLTNVVDGQLVIMVRERALPLFYLRHWLAHGAGSDELPEMGHVVVVTVGAMKVGFIVDHLVGQEEVVIKPLGAMLQGTKGLSGATITGDGRIALILDVPELMRAYARRAA
ncbi:MAG: chemotaxis protein CheA [Gammaproteobacteria bacterium]|nr:chemotaxis protein CheA [Gammaproteobacteria bacterium]